MSLSQNLHADIGMRWLKALLASVIFLFTMATAYTAVVIVQRQQELEDTARYNLSWPLSQAVNELGRFVQLTALYIAGIDGVSADDVALRYEIIVNRTDLIGSSLIRNFIDADPDRRATMASFQRTLIDIEPLLAELRKPTIALQVLGPVRQLEPRLVGLASEAFRYEAELSASDARAVQRLHNLFSLLAAGLVLCGLGFIGLMLWQNRVIRRGRDRLQSLTDDLQRTTVSHQFLDDIMNGMSDGLLVVDRFGVITKVNASACRMMGYGIDALTGQRIADLLDPPSADPGVDLADSLAAATGLRMADGAALPVRIATGPVADGSVVGGTICMFKDLTQELRETAEKAALRERLFEAQKMQAIGTLAGGIAHDFNNILGAILGYSFLALEDLPADHPVRPALISISTAGNRARDLVRQIVTYSRNAVAQKSPIELGPIIETSLAVLRASAPEKVLIASGALPEAVIAGERSQIDQVITNLCQNAVHAIGPAGGTVSVALDLVDCDGQSMEGLAGFKGRAVMPTAKRDDQDSEAETWVGVLEKRRYARVVVEDTGCGMTLATMSRIFEPFFTTKEVGKGTGLGLAAVHGILRTHDGVMRVTSRVGRGSRFELFLPISSEDIGVVKEDKAGAGPKSQGSGRILLVDDNPEILEVARLSLRHCGYETDAHSEAAAALEAFRRHPQRWDLVISDRTMPDMNGEELAQGIRKISPDIPIIMITGFADAQDEARILGVGVDRVLFKPLIGSALSDAVREALDMKHDGRKVA